MNPGTGKPIDSSSVSLTECLGLTGKEMISLVGAGGKTTLMFRLAATLVRQGKKVITTTTTRILEPSREETPCLVVEPEKRLIELATEKRFLSVPHMTLACERIEPKKLRGISPGCVHSLWKAGRIDYMIIEADGAAGRPVKAPNEGEPVIPHATTVIVGLLGIDGMDAVLDEDHAFRSDRVSRVTGVPPGAAIGAEAMALLITHPNGILKGAPASSRIVVFLNKVDLPHGLDKARAVAQEVFAKKHPQIDRIILGQLKKDPPVVEVLFERHAFNG